MYPIKDGNTTAYAIEIHAVRAVQRKYLYRLAERSARKKKLLVSRDGKSYFEDLENRKKLIEKASVVLVI